MAPLSGSETRDTPEAISVVRLVLIQVYHAAGLASWPAPRDGSSTAGRRLSVSQHQ